MKSLHSLFALILIALVSMGAMTACSGGGDEPEPVDNRIPGKILAERLRKSVSNNSGQILLTANLKSGALYGMQMRSAETAIELCNFLTGEEWSGIEEKTVKFRDNLGIVTLYPGSEEGVYSTLTLNVAGVRPFTLKLTTPEYLQNDKMWDNINRVFWNMRCNACHKTYEHFYNDCPSCGIDSMLVIYPTKEK